MKVEHVSIEALIPYALNNRDHSSKQVDRIANSIAEFGFNQPIVVDEKSIVLVGHGRLEAAKKLGLKEVPVVRKEQLSETQKRAYRILDNKLQNDSTWNVESLELELALLEEADFDLSDWGLNDLKKMFPEKIAVEEYESDGTSAKETIIRRGNLLELGSHRLLCGDSTNAEDVKALMGAVKADVVFTDPPYGVNIQGGKNNKPTTIAGDLTQTAIPFSFDLAVTIATKDDARLYFCGGEGNLYLYQKLFEKHCRQLPRHLIWVKNGFTMKPNGYHNQYEIIFHGYKPGGGALSHWYGERTEDAASDVWQISRDAASTYLHPTQKPIQLPTRAISNSCPKGGTVYEPFGGSGSTLLAAEQLGRVCYAVEIDPLYCQVIVDRYKAHCNKVGKAFVCKLNGEDVSEYISKTSEPGDKEAQS